MCSSYLLRVTTCSRGGPRPLKADEAVNLAPLQAQNQSKPWKYSSQTTFLPKTVIPRALHLQGLSGEHAGDRSSLFSPTQGTELQEVTAVVFVPSSPAHSARNEADSILPTLLAQLAIFQVLGVFMTVRVTPELGMGRGILNVPTPYPSLSSLSEWKGIVRCTA